MKRLLKLALVFGAIGAVARLVAVKKNQWIGLSESEVRDKLDARLPDRIPEEKRAAVADKVVTKMRNKGMVREEVDATSPTASSEETPTAAPASADAPPPPSESADTEPTDDADDDIPAG